MIEDFSTYELIDQYLDGKLEGETLLDFQSKLEFDLDFREQFEYQELANNIVKASELNRVKEIIDREYTDTSIFYLRYAKYILGAALVVASLTSMYVYSLYTQKDVEPKQVKQESKTVINSIKTTLQIQKTQSKIEWKGAEVQEEQTDLMIPKSNSIVASFNIANKQFIEKVMEKDKLIPIIIENPILTANREDINPNEAKNALVDSCSLFATNFDLNISPSCENKASGSVNAKTLGNNKNSLYQFKIIGSNSFNKEQSSMQFDDLPSGNYTLIVTKDKKCEIANQTFFVPLDLACLKQKTYSFNPKYGEGFVFADLKENQAVLEIYDRVGKLIIKKEVNKQEEFLWDGRGVNGEKTQSGTYLFYITYKTEKQDLGEILLY